MRPRVRIEQATQEDIALCYGEEFDFPFALVVVRGGDILACCGFFEHEGRTLLFADLGDDVFQYPVTMIKAGKRLIAAAKLRGLPVVTIPDDREEARRTLKHLGFVEGDDGWVMF